MQLDDAYSRRRDEQKTLGEHIKMRFPHSAGDPLDSQSIYLNAELFEDQIMIKEGVYLRVLVRVRHTASGYVITYPDGRTVTLPG